MIGSCQTSVEWSDIRLNCVETSLTRSVGLPDLQFQSLGKVATLDLSAQLWSIDSTGL